MSFPYVTDIVNALFGTEWHLPIATFGTIVAIAIAAAAFVAGLEAKRLEAVGELPPSTAAIVPDLAVVAAAAGIIGARVLYIFDHVDQFVAAPAALIFSRSGFSIYGGLMLGVLAGIAFLRRLSVPIRPMLDATAPSMMLGYAVGRLACQVAGDGDWGIASDLASKPGWLPGWLWAQTYDGNIAGIIIATPGVYPTPLYESAAALALFGVLWMLRRNDHSAGFLFSLYALFAGFERLLIEKIRINVEHRFLGLDLTQAEAISLVVIVLGLAGILVTIRVRRPWIRIVLSLGVLGALSACVPI